MRIFLLLIASLLLIFWIVGFIFRVLIGTIGLAIHFAPLVAIVILGYLFFTRKANI